MRAMLIKLLARDPGAEGGGGGDDKAKEGEKQADPRDAQIATLAAAVAAAEKREADRVAAATLAADKEAAEKGQHKELADKYKSELDATTKKAAELQAREDARIEKLGVKNTERLAKVPKERATLIPKGMGAEDLADYLETNWTLLTGETEMAAGTQRPSGKKSSVQLTPGEKADAAIRNLTDEQYVEIFSHRFKGRNTQAEA